VDLAPTVLDLAGIPEVPSSFVGKSLVPEVYGGPAESRDPIVLDLPEDSHNPQIRAVIDGHLKLIVYDGVRMELYDLAADPGELHDLAKTEPDLLAKMKAIYEKKNAEIPFVESYGGMKLRGGKPANGPMAPQGT
jgi:arylsulfatase A-like enzyme